MDDCTKVLVYGSFDGFAYSTDDSLLISVVLDGGEKVEIPEEFIVSADQMVNKYKIKLKDVIARIEKFDLATKAVWINEMLNKLGSDYELYKYYAGYNQGKFDGAMEREEVTVPQFVADFITEQKKLGHTLSYSIDACMSDRVAEWYWDNSELFARAWIDGYEVEKKRYLVKIKGVGSISFLNHNVQSDLWSINDEDNGDTIRTHHTLKELEKAGFGWVFECPGVEIEEVE
jgi:phage protein